MHLIFLHGPAACGKLTVARALERLTLYPVFHNHLVLDAVGSVFPFGSPPFIRLRQQFWLAVFEEAARAGRSLIFTFAPENTVPDDFIDQTRAVVEAHGGKVLFVALTVSEAEQERRVTAPERRAFHKLNSVEVLRGFRDSGGAAYRPIPDSGLTIDTDAVAPDEAAAMIVGTFGLKPAAAAHVMFPNERPADRIDQA
jgi:chloramphenicol 3-O-phosphotransferase